MAYERDILRILADVGARGISVRKLAKHVYNMNCTLFSQPDFTLVHQSVQQYLSRNSRTRHPMVESTGRRGYYRIIPGRYSEQTLTFQDTLPEDEKENEKPQQDLSLDLFAD